MGSKGNRLGVRARYWFAFGVVSLLAVWALSGKRQGQTALAHRFTVGERRVYKLEFKNVANADFRPLLEEAKTAAGQPQAFTGLIQSFATSVRGELLATVVERDEQGATICYSLIASALDLHVGGQRSDEQSQILLRDVQRNLFASVDQRGRIRSVRFAAGVETMSQGLMRAVLGSIQIALPETDKPQTAWESEEEDTAGRYTARYELQAAGIASDKPWCQAIRKTKLKYLTPEQRVSNTTAGRRVKSDSTVAAQTIQPDTSVLACFDAKSGSLVSLEGSDKSVTTISNRVIGRSETSLAIKLITAEIIADAQLESLKNLNNASGHSVKAVPLSTALSVEEIRSMARRDTLGEATLESLLVELAARQAAGEKEGTTLYLKFRALAYLHPDACVPLGSVLAGAEAGSLTFRILTDALGDVGSSQAQAALLAAIRARRDDWQALLRLIPPLGLTSTPTTETEDGLRDMALRSSDSNVASTAQLALGNIARRLEETAPERAGRIIQPFIARVGVAASAAEIEQLLLVLGNSGLARTLPVISRFASHSDADVRAAAVGALRFIESDQADDVLAKALAADSNSKVRLAAAYALSFRRMSTITYEAHLRAARKDEDSEVRIAALKNLWTEREEFPDVLELLRTLANEDRSKAVRDAASAMIREQ